MSRKSPKKKLVSVRSGTVAPWLVDVPWDHMQ